MWHCVQKISNTAQRIIATLHLIWVFPPSQTYSGGKEHLSRDGWLNGKMADNLEKWLGPVQLRLVQLKHFYCWMKTVHFFRICLLHFGPPHSVMRYTSIPERWRTLKAKPKKTEFISTKFSIWPLRVGWGEESKVPLFHYKPTCHSVECTVIGREGGLQEHVRSSVYGKLGVI